VSSTVNFYLVNVMLRDDVVKTRVQIVQKVHNLQSAMLFKPQLIKLHHQCKKDEKCFSLTVHLFFESSYIMLLSAVCVNRGLITFQASIYGNYTSELVSNRRTQKKA